MAYADYEDLMSLTEDMLSSRYFLRLPGFTENLSNYCKAKLSFPIAQLQTCFFRYLEEEH